MKLWRETEAVNSAGSAVKMKVSEIKADINRQVKSRGIRVVNAMRSAEREVLNGQRSGRKYQKYPYKSMHTASAPGEPPAKRTGMLRLGWYGDVGVRNMSRGAEVIAVLESNEKYASLLENGTSNMAPRPFVEKIKEKAAPEIQKIYSEPYT